MGVFLSLAISSSSIGRLPHARGGVSEARPDEFNGLRSSPRTWGCFWTAFSLPCRRLVFPTHVGVFLWEIVQGGNRVRLPHARGGVSDGGRPYFIERLSSPRTWGCFHFKDSLSFRRSVFPTHVGVFLMSISCSPPGVGLPHARGGVSYTSFYLPSPHESSPRTWGCFCACSLHLRQASVFPTHVGVFPCLQTWRRRSIRLPHARGGVSPYPFAVPYVRVFPTHVGVFPQNSAMPKPLGCLPHARGGVSDSSLYVLITHSSSPRTWGCFCLPSTNLSLFAVFPTHVGVFLSSS